MTTKSKLSPLTLIIIMAVLLFIIAAIWKTTNVDNSEEIYVPVVQEDKPINKKEREVIEDNYDVEYDPDNIEERRKKHSANMNKHLRYRSPEEVMEVILTYQELGDEEKANEYIEFLLRRYPDYEMK